MDTVGIEAAQGCNPVAITDSAVDGDTVTVPEAVLKANAKELAKGTEFEKEFRLLETIESGKMTGDLAIITTLDHVEKMETEEFILAIRSCLEKKLGA